jgi:uncharacterized protein (DUF1697 family)
VRCVALLRGIGPGNPNMRNDKLRAVIEGVGCRNVQSVISSGNVLFDTDRRGMRALEQEIEAAWPQQLGFTSTTIIRTRTQIEQLVEQNPFGDLEDAPSSRLQVTFLQRGPEKDRTPPDTPEGCGYRIVAVTEGALCSSVDLSGATTPDLMRWLEREYGTAITTRTWKTVHRIASKL